MSEFVKGREVQYPVGYGDMLIKHRLKNPKKYQVTACEVENEVVMVNPAINSPFKLEEGKSSSLGLFACCNQSELYSYPLEAWPSHHRSAILGRVIFSDKEGRFYRDIDLKGMGYLFGNNWTKIPGHQGLPWEAEVLRPGKPKGETKDRLGFLHIQDSTNDYLMSEKFIDAGIRTHRVIALIKLHEVIDQGQKITIREALQRGLLDHDYEPVIAVRAFGTKARLCDLATDIDQRLFIADAMEIVRQELDKPSLNEEEYLAWFVKSLGYNVGLIRRLGKNHKYLTSHNITLDCRIVDHDTVSDNSGDGFENDYFEARKSLRDFYNSTLRQSAMNINLMDLFEEGYQLATGYCSV